MALKDWNKVYESPSMKRYQKGNKIIQILHGGFKDWNFSSGVKTGTKIKQKSSKDFENREDVVAFAKKYMRSH